MLYENFLKGQTLDSRQWVVGRCFRKTILLYLLTSLSFVPLFYSKVCFHLSHDFLFFFLAKLAYYSIFLHRTYAVLPLFLKCYSSPFFLSHSFFIASFHYSFIYSSSLFFTFLWQIFGQKTECSWAAWECILRLSVLPR